MRVFRTQLGLICVRQIQVWPYLSVEDSVFSLNAVLMIIT